MATTVVDKATSSTKAKDNLNDWKFPKIPIHKIYKKKNSFRILQTYVIKDFEETIAFKSTDKFRFKNLLSFDFLHGCSINKKHKFLHLGLVQVSIKPLVRDGLETPMVVCLRDSRHRNIKDSMLAVVSTNLSQGAFYFNCFPGFSVSLADNSYEEALSLGVITTGAPVGVSVAMTVRVVCKAMVDLSAEYLEVPVLGKTIYVHMSSGVSATTEWDEVIEDQSSAVEGSVGRSSNPRIVHTCIGTSSAKRN